MPQDQAQRELENAGLQSEIEQQESSEEQAGTVLEQSPNGGEQAKRGSSVTLVVGSGPAAPQTVAVPEVVNMGYADAEATLAQSGLMVGNVEQLPSNTVAEGVVFAQGYDAGVQVEPGTAVNLEVSSGPPPASAPDSSNQNTPPPDQPDQPQQPQQQPEEQQPSPQQQRPQQQQDLNDQIQDQLDQRLEDAGIKEEKDKGKEDKGKKDN
jgi:serine/threonine-protein kinase